MSIIVNSTLQGIPAMECRPRSKTFARNMRDIAGDYAAAYEALTGIETPNSTLGSLTATAHVHDGTDGAIIPIPLAQFRGPWLLDARASGYSWGGNYPGWYPFLHAPFHVPTGVTQVTVIVTANSDSVRHTVKGIAQSSSLADVTPGRWCSPVDNESPFAVLNDGRVTLALWNLNVNAGAWNVLKMEAWDGEGGEETVDGSGNTEFHNIPVQREIFDVIILPHTVAPQPMPQWFDATGGSDTEVLIADELVDIDGNLVDQTSGDNPVDSYLLSSFARNFPLLWETLTNQKAVNRATQTINGHRHKADLTATAGGVPDLEQLGAEIEQPLGAWAYGTVRPNTYDATSTVQGSSDTPNGKSVWRGATAAPTVKIGSGAGTELAIIARHRVLMPAMTAANMASKVEVAALCWSDTASSIDVRARFGNDAASAFATATTGAFSGSDTKTLVTMSVDGHTAEARNTLEIALQMSSYKAAAAAVLGVAARYQP